MPGPNKNPESKKVGESREKTDLAECSSTPTILEKMADFVPRRVAEDLLKANIELTNECSKRWREEEKVKTSGLNIFVQTIARCFCVVVISLALFGISWNLRGCSIGAGRSGRDGTAPVSGLCTTTNQVVMTSINSIAR